MTKSRRALSDSEELGENKGTSKVCLQSAVAISFMASSMNRNPSFISGFTHGFADMGRAVHAKYARLVTFSASEIGEPPTQGTFLPNLQHSHSPTAAVRPDRYRT